MVRFATLWGEIGGFGALYLQKKVTMENRAKVQSRRGKGLKFDQEWKDAVDRLPKHYRDEICAAIEAYQRDLTVIEVSEGVPRAIFMLIMPTIRRRYRARELRRLARERKAASSRRQATEQRPSIVRNISAQPNPAVQPKSAMQSDSMKHPKSAVHPRPAMQPDPVVHPKSAMQSKPAVQSKSVMHLNPAVHPKSAMQSDSEKVVKQPESASPAPVTVPSSQQSAPVSDSAVQPRPAPAAVNTPAVGQPGKSTLEKLIAHSSRHRNRHRRR